MTNIFTIVLMLISGVVLTVAVLAVLANKWSKE